MLSNFRSRYINVSNTELLISTVEDTIPLPVDSFKIAHVQGSVRQFTATINCKVIDVDELVSNLKQKSNVTIRQRSEKVHAKNHEYSKQIYFRCHHNTRHQPTMGVKGVLQKNVSVRIKNTNCPFSMVIRYKSVADEYPVIVKVDWDHNHSIDCLHSLSFKDIPEEVSSSIRDLFKNGFTPAHAYREFLRKKREDCNSSVELVVTMSDRSKFPRRSDFNNLYVKYNNDKFGSLNLESMYESLQKRITEKELKSPETTIRFQKFDIESNDPFILSIVTPLMLRVHKKIKTSGELVFFDSSGGMEEFNLRVFIMVTHTPIGALPLGIIITSDETTETLVSAFELFRSSLPEYAFYGKGVKGPLVIMTDNCSELHDALRAVWESAVLLLCIFHIMQQVWRWLFERKHNIKSQDRPEIMSLFKKLVYAQSEEEAEDIYEVMLDSVQSYRNLVLYIQELYDIKERWCIAFRRDLIIRGNYTNNYVEAQILVLKDNVLNRTKEVNINGLVDKLFDDFDEHYKAKLISACNSRFEGIYSSRFKGRSKSKGSGVGYQLPPFEQHQEIKTRITKTDGGFYLVPSFTCNDKMYTVDMDMGMCECSVGCDGSACKHQYFVWLYHHEKSNNFVPYMDAEMRREYCYIALGEVLPDSYFEGLHDQVLMDESNANFEPNLADEAEDVTTEDNVIEEVQNVEEHVMLGRGPLDQWTVAECKDSLTRAINTLNNLVESRSHDQTFLKGVIKFSDRVVKYQNQPSKMSSSLHSFGVETYSRKQATATSLLKKARLGKKIHVQPGAVQRRKKKSGIKNGSRSAVTSKGMTKHVNPFDTTSVSKKRVHSFVQNVEQNVAVPKKAGRSMGSKTKLKSTTTRH